MRCVLLDIDASCPPHVRHALSHACSFAQTKIETIEAMGKRMTWENKLIACVLDMPVDSITTELYDAARASLQATAAVFDAPTDAPADEAAVAASERADWTTRMAPAALTECPCSKSHACMLTVRSCSVMCVAVCVCLETELRTAVRWGKQVINFVENSANASRFKKKSPLRGLMAA